MDDRRPGEAGGLATWVDGEERQYVGSPVGQQKNLIPFAKLGLEGVLALVDMSGATPANLVGTGSPPSLEVGQFYVKVTS